MNLESLAFDESLFLSVPRPFARTLSMQVRDANLYLTIKNSIKDFYHNSYTEMFVATLILASFVANLLENQVLTLNPNPLSLNLKPETLIPASLIANLLLLLLLLLLENQVLMTLPILYTHMTLHTHAYIYISYIHLMRNTTHSFIQLQTLPILYTHMHTFTYLTYILCVTLHTHSYSYRRCQYSTHTCIRLHILRTSYA